MRPVFALLLALLATPLFAIDPSEMLSDPDLEARARGLDHQIRCVKCQSEVIASSNAEWAVDARRTVRELVEGGATDDEVKDWFLERYGEFVLMNPSMSGSTLILWLAGPLMLLIAGGVGFAFVRSRSDANVQSSAVAASLSDTEQARLDEILRK